MLLQGKARQLGHAKRELERDLSQLKDQLDQQKDHRIEQERRVGAHTLLSTYQTVKVELIVTSTIDNIWIGIEITVV